MKLTEVFAESDRADPILRKPYLIAEAGVNHEGSMDTAKRLVDEAKEGGAHAIKFQTYKAETLASKDSPAYWDTTKEQTESQFELFKKYDKFWKNEFETLKSYCDSTGIEFLSTPFDIESAHFLNNLMDVFKISSSDITNHPFIDLISSFGKPIILSTGASTIEEIGEAVTVIQKHNNPTCLMHCILNYPTKDEDANLGMITDLKNNFPDAIAGYSDHTLPGDMQNLLTASLLGAKILEKHFTFDKELPGNDHYHSMDKKDLKAFWKKTDHTFETMGSFVKEPLQTEEISRENARRSLVAKISISKGEAVEEKHLTWKRPASGISPKDIDKVIGSIALADIEKDTILQENMFGVEPTE